RYAATRQALAEKLGADPGPQLQATHQAILRGELEPAPAVAAAAPSPAPTPPPARPPDPLPHLPEAPHLLDAPQPPATGQPPEAPQRPETAQLSEAALAQPDRHVPARPPHVPPAGPSPAGGAVAAQLPAVPADFTGRAVQVRQLVGRLSPGSGGSGMPACV